MSDITAADPAPVPAPATVSAPASAPARTDLAPAPIEPDGRALALAAECPDCVFLPGTAEYDAGRVPWNLAIDLQPVAVARPRHPAELAAVVRAAGRQGLRVAPQGSGHGAGPMAGRDLSGVVLVRLDAWRTVTVDPEARTARAAAGALWRDVVEAAAPYGLAPLHGSSHDVGVAGYTIGGGLSFYARKHGLATNALVSAEVVAASGEIRRVDAASDPDLFWALRGGGGNVAIVTELEFGLFEIPDAVAGMLLWDLTRAEPVLRRWVEWCSTAPDEVTTSLRFMRFPPLPELPDFLRGRRLVVIDGAFLTDDARASELLAPLRALAPELDTFARVPAPAVLEMHMDPPAPTPAVGDGTILGELDDAGLAAFLAEFGPDADTALMFAELRQLGGAIGRRLPTSGAVATLDGSFVLLCVALAVTPELAALGHAHATRGVTALAPWHNGRRYLNFNETRVDTSQGYAPEDWERLRRVRASVDPDGLLVPNHPIEP